MAKIELRFPPSFADDPTVLTGVAYLDADRYRFTFRWSPRDDRDGAWRMDVTDAAGVLRVAGVPLYTSDDLLRPFRYRSRRVPPGRLRVVCDPDPTNPRVRRDPGLHDLGRAAHVEYVEAAAASAS